MSELNTALIKPYPSLADAICARVGFRGIDDWLRGLSEYLSVPFESVLPEQLTESPTFHLDSPDMTLTFRHPHAVYTTEGDLSRWFLSSALFRYDFSSEAQWLMPAPYQLDVNNDCLNDVCKKLSDDYTALTHADIESGDRRQSFFLDNKPQTVEITWRENMVGIERIWVCHIGREQDFQLPSERGDFN